MKKLCVIGAGIIGASSAYMLHEAGYDVVLLDSADRAGTGASDTNAMQLCYGTIAPYAGWRDIAKYAKYALWPDDAAPFYIKPDRTQARLKFYLQSGLTALPWRYEKTRLKLFALAAESQQVLKIFTDHHPDIDFGLKNTGKIHIFENKADFAIMRTRVDKINKIHGQGIDVLSAEDVYTREPDLREKAQTVIGGFHTPGDQSGDSEALCRGLVGLLSDSPRFTFLEKHKVTDFEIRQGHVTGLVTEAGRIEADDFVIAAGAGSYHLTEKIGAPITMAPIRGYSLTLANAPLHFKSCLTDIEHKIALNSDKGRLRISGMMDIDDWRQNAVNSKRAAYFKDKVQNIFPTLDLTTAELRTGLRPVMGNSLPMIGRYKYRNLWLNTGHGMYGWTLAFGAAARLREKISPETRF